MLQATHIPPTPLSRPRPPSRNASSLPTARMRHSSSTSAHSTHSAHSAHSARSARSIGSSAAGVDALGSPALARVKTFDEDGLGESPLSAAAKLLRARVPGVLDDVPEGGVQSLAQGWGWSLESISSQFEDSGEAEGGLEAVAEALEPDGEVGAGGEEVGSMNNGEPLDEEWVAQRSRQELEALLLQADRVIRERERDLGIAASIGKSLLENNIALRARQETLTSALTSHRALPPTSPCSDRRKRRFYRRAELIEGQPPPSPCHSRTGSLAHRRRSSTVSVEWEVEGCHSEEGEGAWTDEDNSFGGTMYGQRQRKSRRTSPSISSTSSASRYGYARFPVSTQKHAMQLAKLEQANEALSAQLSELEQEARDEEKEGKKRLGRMKKEVDRLRWELLESEERCEYLSSCQDSNLLQEAEEDELGKEAERLRKGMRDVLLGSVNGGSEWGDGGENLGDGTSVDSGPHSNPITPAPPSADAQPDQSTPLREAHRFASASSLASSISAASQTTPQSALITTLMAQVEELRESQKQFERERQEMRRKFEEAGKSVEGLRGQMEGLEREVLRENSVEPENEEGGGSAKRRAKGNRDLIATLRVCGQSSPTPASSQCYSPSQSPINPNGSHFRFPSPAASPSPSLHVPLGGNLKPSRPPYDRRSVSSNSVGSLSISSSSPLKHGAVWRGPTSDVEASEEEVSDYVAKGSRTLASEMGSAWSGSDAGRSVGQPLDQDDYKYADSDADNAGCAGKRQPWLADDAKSYSEIERAVSELPIRWVDNDPTVTARASPASHKFLMMPPSPSPTHSLPLGESSGTTRGSQDDDLEGNFRGRRLWGAGRNGESILGLEDQDDPVLGHEEAERVQALRRRRLQRLKAKASFNSDSGSRSASTSTIKGSEATAEGSRQAVLHRFGLGDDDEEEGDWEESSEEPWDYLTALDHDNRPVGSRGTDYYPVSLRARNAPTMVARRLQDRWTKWALLWFTWLQFLIMLGLAVGWAIARGPKPVPAGRERKAVEAGESQPANSKRRARVASPDSLKTW